MQRLCVFCGSNPGTRPIFTEAARALGEVLVTNRLGLVYGGASVGTMGTLADSVLAAGGEAIGVIPRKLVEYEVAHDGLSELHIVETLHERKALMTELSDGFVVLPGGFGTHDELFEALTWQQLGVHAKPIGLLDLEGYYEALVAHLERCVREGFLTPANHARLLVRDRPDELVEALQAWRDPGPGI